MLLWLFMSAKYMKCTDCVGVTTTIRTPTTTIITTTKAAAW